MPMDLRWGSVQCQIYSYPPQILSRAWMKLYDNYVILFVVYRMGSSCAHSPRALFSCHYRKLALCRLQFSLPTVFSRHSAKRSLCQLEFPAVGKTGFADCLALPTARQLAKNSSRQRQVMVDAIHTVTTTHSCATILFFGVIQNIFRGAGGGIST
jgi:hypothetical protein